MFLIILAFAGLVLSAFFSGAELAFISSNPLQIEVWARQERRGASRALSLMGNPASFLISVLVGTTLSNVVATSFATIYLVRYGWHPALVLAIITTTILLFGEILPKTISGERPNQFFRLVAPIHYLWQLLFIPVIIPLRKLSDYLNPISPSNSGLTRESTLEREDLKLLFTSPKDSQVLLASEKELITQVFDLGETPVAKAMTPRIEIGAVAETDDLASVVHTFIESGYSKLPVYQGNLDNIIGVVYLYDLFKDPTDLASIVHPVIRVPESNTTIAVLKQLQRARSSIAIVIDEYGGTAGLVTPEDLFEELFGEFEDEFDSQISEITPLPDGSLLVDGKTKVEDLINRFQLEIPAGGYETIAGYLSATLDRIPHTGERIYLPLGLVIIKRSTPRLVEQVQIHPKVGDSLVRGG